MYKKTILFIILGVMFFPCYVKADNVSINCGSNIYSGEEVSCVVSANSDYEAIAFHAKIIITDDSGNATDKLIAKSFVPTTQFGDDISDGNIDTIFSDVMTGTYNIGTLKLTVSDDIEAATNFKLTLDEINLSNDTPDGGHSLGQASSIIKVLGKKPNDNDPGTDNPGDNGDDNQGGNNNDTPGGNDNQGGNAGNVDNDNTGDNKPTTDDNKKGEINTGTNKGKKSDSSATDNGGFGNSESNSNYGSNAGSSSNTASNSNSKASSKTTNPPTANVSFVIVLILMLEALAVAYYFYNKRNQSNI